VKFAWAPAFLLGVAVTLGWLLDVRLLTHPFGLTVSSSMGYILMLCSLAVATVIYGQGKLRSIGLGFAIVVCLASAATFIEDIMEADFGLNHIWYQSTADSPGLSFPGPLAPSVSLTFLLIGISLLLFHRQDRGRLSAFQPPILVAAVLSAMPLIGDLCGSPYLCTFAGCIKLPVPMSLTATLLCLSVLFAQPERGITQIYMGSGIGSKLTRRFTLFVAALPLLVWLKTLGERSGLYEPALGWVVFAIMTVVLGIVLIASNADSLNKIESARTEAEERLDKLSKSMPVVNAPRITRHLCMECWGEFDETVETCPNDGSPVSKVAGDSLVGTVLAERYQILSVLGRGGMSSVYKAQHLSLPKMYAIKLMHSHLMDDVSQIKRFRHEAEAASLLSHPNLISVHDFGITAEGQPYIVMDYIDGEMLEDVIAKGRLSVGECVSIFVQVCDGLDHAHRNGLVHRDLKPSNIMLVKNDSGPPTVKVVDFGLAKNLMLGQSRKLTATGEVFGTPHYMSPEQCVGLEHDMRSDIYSLGCIMYECIAGVAPFDGVLPIELMRKHVDELPPPFAETLGVPNWLSDEIMKALQKKKSKRHKNALELRDALLGGAVVR
jgi:tRNA A-37 threonylcarbamoyl transferase component Bud32